MQEKDIQEKANVLGGLARTVSSVTRSYKENFNKDVIFLTEEEIRRLQQIAGLFASFKIANFSSASGNEKITQQLKTILLVLINGKAEKDNFEQIKQSLQTLKQQDEQNIKVVRWHTIAFGVFTLIGILASILILVVAPPLWPFVILIAVATLSSFGLTLFSLKIHIDQAENDLYRAWGDKFASKVASFGITELLNTLTQDDIGLLKKVNSLEWNNDLAAATTKLTEELSLKPIQQGDSKIFSSTPGSKDECVQEATNFSLQNK